MSSRVFRWINASSEMEDAGIWVSAVAKPSTGDLGVLKAIAHCLSTDTDRLSSATERKRSRRKEA
jgi:hypothetical protein